MAATAICRVPFKVLIDVVRSIFERLQLASADALLAATILVDADVRGIATHGVANLDAIYVPQLRAGLIDACARAESVLEAGPIAVVDAKRQLGLLAGVSCVDMAIERARIHGVGIVAARNSTHFGAAGYYVRRAATRGLIAVASSNLGTQAVARPPDGALEIVGSNPISIGAPAGEHPPFVLDMSTTVVATSRIKQCAARGEAVPPGWLVDGQRRPTTDAAAYVNGQAFIEMLGGAGSSGGYKGFGLALAVDVLAGILPGAGVGPNAANLAGRNARDGKPADIGHFFLTIDPVRFRDASGFSSAMDGLLESVLACPPVRGASVCYPGWLEAEHEREAAQLGVPIECRIWERIRVLGVELGAMPSTPWLGCEP